MCAGKDGRPIRHLALLLVIVVAGCKDSGSSGASPDAGVLLDAAAPPDGGEPPASAHTIASPGDSIAGTDATIVVAQGLAVTEDGSVLVYALLSDDRAALLHSSSVTRGLTIIAQTEAQDRSLYDSSLTFLMPQIYGPSTEEQLVVFKTRIALLGAPSDNSAPSADAHVWQWTPSDGLVATKCPNGDRFASAGTLLLHAGKLLATGMCGPPTTNTKSAALVGPPGSLRVQPLEDIPIPGFTDADEPATGLLTPLQFSRDGTFIGQLDIKCGGSALCPGGDVTRIIRVGTDGGFRTLVDSMLPIVPNTSLFLNYAISGGASSTDQDGGAFLKIQTQLDQIYGGEGPRLFARVGDEGVTILTHSDVNGLDPAPGFIGALLAPLAVGVTSATTFGHGGNGDAWLVGVVAYEGTDMPFGVLWKIRNGDFIPIAQRGRVAPGFSQRLISFGGVRSAPNGRLAFMGRLENQDLRLFVDTPCEEAGVRVIDEALVSQVVPDLANAYLWGVELPNFYGINYSANFRAHGRAINSSGEVLANLTVTHTLPVTHVVLFQVPGGSCDPVLRINSGGDAGDNNIGDGKCSTGRTADGAPECTLRAALQEAEASSPPKIAVSPNGPYSITLSSPLPPITKPLVLDALLDSGERGLVIHGGQVDPVFDIGSTGVQISSLEIRDAAGVGISDRAADVTGTNAALLVQDVRVQGSCGFALVTKSVDLSLRGRENRRTELIDNGKAAGCDGGGYLQLGDSRVRIEMAEISRNRGPGILMEGNLDFTAPFAQRGFLDIVGNGGTGVAIASGTGVVVGSRPAFTATSATTLVVSDNGGPGIHSEGGGIELHSDASIANNVGWGLEIEFGGLDLGDPDPLRAGYAVQVSGNGSGTGCQRWTLDGASATPSVLSEPCPGGGVFVYTPGTSPAIIVNQTSIVDNAGVGLLTNASVTTRSQVVVSRNGGGGIAVSPGSNGTTGSNIAIRAIGGPLTVENNGGDALASASGRINLDDEVRISGNGGHGVVSDTDVNIGTTSSQQQVISANGTAPSCPVWTIDQGDNPVSTIRSPCAGAGVRAFGSAILWNIDLVDHRGIAIVVDGNLDAYGLLLCNNASDMQVGGTTTEANRLACP